tara:strand:+ start:227 stop:415 length:189 start_codon:yes stop_codon:yes gene_type:complete
LEGEFYFVFIKINLHNKGLYKEREKQPLLCWLVVEAPSTAGIRNGWLAHLLWNISKSIPGDA